MRVPSENERNGSCDVNRLVSNKDNDSCNASWPGTEIGLRLGGLINRDSSNESTVVSDNGSDSIADSTSVTGVVRG